jgi:hypothetical protein
VGYAHRKLEDNMPRPTNKKELLELAETNFKKVLDCIKELSDEIKNETYTPDELNDRDKTVSDVVCHFVLPTMNLPKRG